MQVALRRHVLGKHGLQPARLQIVPYDERRQKCDTEAAKGRLPQRFVVIEREIAFYGDDSLPIFGSESPLGIGIRVRIDETVVAREVLRPPRHSVSLEI